jgi:hypothetical protein
MRKFMMVPAGSVKAGEIVAVAGTPLRCAQPAAEVNRLDDGQIELVFMERSVVGDYCLRVARVFADQCPVALILDVESEIGSAVQRWLLEAEADHAQ